MNVFLRPSCFGVCCLQNSYNPIPNFLEIRSYSQQSSEDLWMLCAHPPIPCSQTERPDVRAPQDSMLPSPLPFRCSLPRLCALREGTLPDTLLSVKSVFFAVFLCAGSSLLHGLSSSCGEQGLLFTVLCGFVTVAAPLVGEHGLQQLWHEGSVVMVPRLWRQAQYCSAQA